MKVPTSSALSRVPWSLLLAISCLSAAVLVVELTLTRVFSVTMFYHFAFLAISVAMFGLSASGVFIYVTPRLHPTDGVGRQLQVYAALFWIVATFSAVVLLRMRVSPTYSLGNAFRMVGVYLTAAAPFVAGGAGLALAVSRLHSDIGRVYAADLLGAAAGSLLLIPLLNAIGGPGALLLAAELGAVASLLFAVANGRVRAPLAWLPLAGGTLVLAAQVWHPWLDVFGAKGHEGAPRLFSKWNSFSRIAVYNAPHPDWGLSDTYTESVPQSLYMDIDAAASTPILRAGGSGGSPSYLRFELTALAYAIKTTPHVLVIGPGGGRDLWTAVIHGARRVEGVEVNPIIVRDVMGGAFREYSGDVYHAPGVSVVADDGRSYVTRSTARYDLIQASLVDGLKPGSLPHAAHARYPRGCTWRSQVSVSTKSLGSTRPTNAQDLGCGEIEGMQRQSRIRMLYQREEPVRAVACPLHEHRLIVPANFRLDESRAFSEHAHQVPGVLQRRAVGLPRHRQRFLGIVEHIEIPGQPRRADEFVQRRPAGEIALATPQPVLS